MSRIKPSVVANTLFLLVAVGLAVGLALWLADSTSDDGSAPADARGRPSSEDLLELPPFRFDVERLASEWSAERAEAPELALAETERGLLERLYELNQRLARGTLQTGEIQQLSDDFSSQVSDYISRHGVAKYRQLGWTAIEAFQTSVRDALERARQSGTRPSELLGGSGQGAEWQVELAGHLANFLTIAESSGLIDVDGRLRYDAQLLTVLFRFRWFGFAQSYASADLMTPYEQEVFWRWRIEAAENVPLAQRLAMIDQAAPIYTPQIDLDVIRGRVCLRAGDRRRARQFFQRAVDRHPEEPFYERLGDALDERLGAPTSAE
jgi:hypothetical protein